jgi:adenine-specific DNA-methyltransferase
MCLHAGYAFNPRQEPWWMHGQSTENDFIFVTASTLTSTQLTQMSQELEENQSLLVYCGAFKADPKEIFQIFVFL